MGADLERWSYNTAVAHCMELVNLLQRYVRSDAGPHEGVLDEACDSLLLLMAPMCPHVTAELWERRHTGLAVGARPALAASRSGPGGRGDRHPGGPGERKGTDRLEVDPSIGEEEATALALASPRVVQELDGRAPRRVVARPPRLVNVVV